jgi:protein-disulfide isomerase
MDVELYREMSQHPYCAPGAHGALMEQATSKFKGRILPQEDLAVLEQALHTANKTNEQIKVYDVSRVTDKLSAMKRGFRKTPTAIINGEKYEGLEQISKAISNKSGP